MNVQTPTKISEGTVELRLKFQGYNRRVLVNTRRVMKHKSYFTTEQGKGRAWDMVPRKKMNN